MEIFHSNKPKKVCGLWKKDSFVSISDIWKINRYSRTNTQTFKSGKVCINFFAHLAICEISTHGVETPCFLLKRLQLRNRIRDQSTALLMITKDLFVKTQYQKWIRWIPRNMWWIIKRNFENELVKMLQTESARYVLEWIGMNLMTSRIARIRFGGSVCPFV